MTIAEREEELLLRARDGDRAAFVELVSRTEKRLRCVVASRCTRADLIEDVLQETYLAAWESLANYRPEGRAFAWLKAVARNVLLHQLRIRARQAQASGDRIEEVVAEEQLARCSDEEQWRHEHLRHLQRCLERLSERNRTILLRSYEADWDLARLAAAYRKPKEALAAFLHRLRVKLRRCFERERVVS